LRACGWPPCLGGLTTIPPTEDSARPPRLEPASDPLAPPVSAPGVAPPRGGLPVSAELPRWAWWGVFGVGIALSLLMIWRRQVVGHQFEFLVLGWTLAELGRWLPFGCTVTGGGVYPGGLTTLLFGLPLWVWMDFRSPSVFALLSHVAAYFLLDRALREVTSLRVRQVFFVLYWLNPWRMYFSAHGWNIDWVFLLGALHFWSAVRLRRQAGFGATLVHVLAIGAAAQLHASFVILFFATVLLWASGYLRLRWSACWVGGAIFALSLVPWLLVAREHPEVIPTGGNSPGRGLLVLYPIVRGLLYWLRYPSLLAGRLSLEWDFTPVFGAGVEAWLGPLGTVFTRGVAPLTLVPAVLANYWLWRRAGPVRWRVGKDLAPRDWLVGVVRATFGAAVLSFALSPQTIVMWHTLIVLHVAVVPVALWLVVWGVERPAWLRRGMLGYAALAVALLAATAVAAPLFRAGGRGAVELEVREHYPMLDQLGITGRTPIVVTEVGASLDLVEMAERKRTGQLYTPR
jgi:hypothetical protein